MIKRIWVFAKAPSSKERGLFLKRVEWLNLTDVAFFVNSLKDCRFQLSSNNANNIERTAQKLKDINVDTHLVTWIRPIKTYMTNCANKLRPLCENISARSLLFDAEEPWTRNTCGTNCNCGKGGANKATTVLEEHWPFSNWPCELGVSGITFIPNAVKPLVNRCMYTLPQAYSVDKEENIWRPGTTQKAAHKRWRDFWRGIWVSSMFLPLARKPMVMGLAAWNLNRPEGISQTEAMQIAFTTAEKLRDPAITEVAYWSLNWIIKSRERASFIRNAGLKARKGLSQTSQIVEDLFES